MSALRVVDGIPMNGFDRSRWNGNPGRDPVPDWVQFYGMKASDPKYGDGTDDRFEQNRNVAAQAAVRFRALYFFVRADRPVQDQIALFSETIGSLRDGECVYPDVEDHGLTMDHLEEIEWWMNVIFPDRWMLYVNDTTSVFGEWMLRNAAADRVPMMVPHYGEGRVDDAIAWTATVLQSGIAIPPGMSVELPCDVVVRPDVLERLCHS